MLVFLAVGVGFAAINTGNNLLYLLLGWQLSFIVASGVLSEMTLRNLQVERRPPSRIYANEPFLMEVVVGNTKSRNASYSIEVEDLMAGQPIDKRCYFLKIPNGKSQRASYRHSFPHRGMYTLSGYRLATKFPFSLFRKSRDIEAPLALVVYPARVPVQRPASTSADRGDAMCEKLGRRGEFFGLREHRRGDDRRDVNWKSSARLGRLLVREYEDELARRVAIHVDNALPLEVRDAIAGGNRPVGARGVVVSAVASRSERRDPSHDEHIAAVERAISVAASLAAAYLEAGWTVELAARGCHVPGGTGRIHEAKIGKALALLEYASEEIAFPIQRTRVESVLIHAAGSTLRGRPPAQTVIHA